MGADTIAASVLACLVAHKHRLEEGPPRRSKTPRTKPPLHVQALARIMAASAEGMAHALTLDGEEAVQRWNRIAATLIHVGVDPNWRRRPSVLDELRGWVVRPAKSRGGGRKKRLIGK